MNLPLFLRALDFNFRDKAFCLLPVSASVLQKAAYLYIHFLLFKIRIVIKFSLRKTIMLIGISLLRTLLHSQQ